VLSGVVWFGQHAPHASTFAPIYGSTTTLAPSYTKGTIYQFSRESSWWAACAVENYAEKMYNVISVEIKAEQKLLETTGQQAIAKMDAQALSVFKAKGGDVKSGVVAERATIPTAAELAVKDLLTEWTVKWGEHVTSSWWALFERCLTKYRDGFILQHHYPPSTLKPVFYPAWYSHALALALALSC
jgi:dipeptidase